MPIALNPSTGEALRLEGDQWIPTQKAVNPQTGEMRVFDGADWVAAQSPAPAQSVSGNIDMTPGASGALVPDQPQPTQNPPGQQSTALSDLGTMASNIPSSAGHAITSMVQPFIHPVQTAKNFYSLGKGLVELAIPGEQADEKTAKAVGQFFKDRYGSVDAVRKTMIDDPVGFVLDLSTVLTGGGAALRGAGKVAEVANATKTANALGQAGTVTGDLETAINPLTQSVNALKAGARGTGALIDTLGTHAGSGTALEAFRAGAAGGKADEAFTQNMRGNAPAEDVVNQAKAALNVLKAQRSAQYRVGMLGVKSDKTVLDMNPIVQTLVDQGEKGRFKGIEVNSKAAGVIGEIRDKVMEFANANPAEFHTPEGLDALKRAIGDIRDTTQYGTPARRAADEIYHSVRDQIVKQAPVYAKTMADYEKASDLIREIENTLSLKPKANVDSSLRKLQSILRNNANTNYGRRVELVKKLKEVGADTIIPAIAGQSMSSLAPRGINRLAASVPGLFVTGSAAAAISPWMLALLPLQSPRLVGEVSRGLGKVSRAVPSATNQGSAALAGFQLNRIPPAQ